MSAPFRITLVQLKADLSAVAPAGEKIEHGYHTAEEVCRLAGKLQQLDVASHPKAEPGIIVHRGDRGWRIAVHQGRLRMHKSMSLFDDFWTADTPQDLAELPPFRIGGTGNSNPAHHSTAATPKSMQTLRAVAEVAGLFVVALVLIAVGLRYGLPQHRLGDPPADVTFVTSADERATIFAAVAGTYATGKTMGHQRVTITKDGQVSVGTVGKEGIRQEDKAARAGRRGDIPCVVTAWGTYFANPAPDAIQVRSFKYRRDVATQ